MSTKTTESKNLLDSFYKILDSLSEKEKNVIERRV
jgi:hypothetical protein